MEGGLVEQDPGAGLQGQGVVASFRPCRHWGSISREGVLFRKKKNVCFLGGLEYLSDIICADQSYSNAGCWMRVRNGLSGWNMARCWAIGREPPSSEEALVLSSDLQNPKKNNRRLLGRPRNKNNFPQLRTRSIRQTVQADTHSMEHNERKSIVYLGVQIEG